MSEPATFASLEVALQRERDHFPCDEDGQDLITLYRCPCETAILHACSTCGLCLFITLDGEAPWCIHAQALYNEMDGMRRGGRIVDGEIKVEMQPGVGLLVGTGIEVEIG